MSLLDKPVSSYGDVPSIFDGYTGSAPEVQDMPPCQSILPTREVFDFLGRTVDSLLKLPARGSSWLFDDGRPWADILS